MYQQKQRTKQNQNSYTGREAICDKGVDIRRVEKEWRQKNLVNFIQLQKKTADGKTRIEEKKQKGTETKKV